MKKIGNASLCEILAVATLMAATGCRSTGSSNQAAREIEASPAEPTIATPIQRPAPEAPGLQTVYFDYDRWQLRDEARRALRSNAQHIEAIPAPEVVTVSGHCDERGSEEYNLALGEQRAEAVKRYLVDLGVPAARIRTVSFGESRPAVPGQGEEAWSRNRRAELSFDTLQAAR